MKRLVSLMLALLLIITAQSVVVAAPSSGSSAGSSAWATSYINEAISLGIVPDELLYNYQAGITRGEFCKAVVRVLMAKSGTVDNEAVFVSHFNIDLNARPFDDTIDRYILMAYELNIVNGTGNRTFAPNNLITRQEAATMLTRAAAVYEFTSYTGTPAYFVDSGTFAAWAASSIDFVSATGIMGGVGNNMFSPHTNYTREQSITTMLRLFHAFPREYYAISGSTPQQTTPPVVEYTPTPAPTPAPEPTPAPTLPQTPPPVLQPSKPAEPEVYPGTNIRTFTSVTGTPLKDVYEGDVLTGFVYDLVEYSDGDANIFRYIEYLIDEHGFELGDTESDEEANQLILTVYNNYYIMAFLLDFEDQTFMMSIVQR